MLTYNLTNSVRLDVIEICRISDTTRQILKTQKWWKMNNHWWLLFSLLTKAKIRVDRIYRTTKTTFITIIIRHVFIYYVSLNNIYYTQYETRLVFFLSAKIKCLVNVRICCVSTMIVTLEKRTDVLIIL